MLQCGHCYCLECIKVLVGRSNVDGRHQRLRCPVCRQLTSFASISYVSTRSHEEEDTERVKVSCDFIIFTMQEFHFFSFIRVTTPQKLLVLLNV